MYSNLNSHRKSDVNGGGAVPEPIQANNINNELKQAKSQLNLRVI
jgi:hypothetical protein